MSEQTEPPGAAPVPSDGSGHGRSAAVSEPAAAAPARDDDPAGSPRSAAAATGPLRGRTPLTSGRLNQLLNSVADAGRELLRRGSAGARSQTEPIGALCRALLSTRGEASGTAIAREICDAFDAQTDEERLQFFLMLEADFGVDPEAVTNVARTYDKTRDFAALMALTDAVEAPRQELFRRINMAPNGTATLVGMREDILRLLPAHPTLRAVDADLKHLLASWFNRGFLYFQQIDWDTSASILAKVMAYETVHRMEGWDDLRRRLAADRRCFAFFHPALPDEPLIFVEVALVRGMARTIRAILDRDDDPVHPTDADTAIFYSINNCQAGLRGISFGNFLIKQVVLELRRDLPHLKTFATLSPVPGFRRWLAARLAQADDAISERDAAALTGLDAAGWERDAQLGEAMKGPLMRLCARYLVHASDDGQPLDPVARFHLRNGARLERINWQGDLSPRGIKSAAGLLVNYLYDLKTIEKNHEEYVKNGKVIAATEVTRLAR